MIDNEEVIIKVTIEQFYFLDRDVLDRYGSVEKVIEEWFGGRRLHHTHIPRDRRRMSGLSRMVSFEISDEFSPSGDIGERKANV